MRALNPDRRMRLTTSSSSRFQVAALILPNTTEGEAFLDPMPNSKPRGRDAVLRVT